MLTAFFILLAAFRRLTPRTKELITRYLGALTLEANLKVTWGFYAIATRMDKVYEITLTAVVRQLLSRINIVIHLGLDSVNSMLTCMGFDGYLARLVFWMTLPLALGGAIIVGVAAKLVCKCRCSLRALRNGAAPLLVRMVFVLYPLIVNVAFEVFSCYSALDGGVRYLIADISVECETEEHDTVLALAWGAISVYAFGLLALNAMLLYCARTAIRTKRSTALSEAISFLYCEYKPFVYYWECCEMLRRLCLVGVFVLIKRGSILQLVVGTAFCAAWLLLQMQAAPYAALGVEALASGCSFGLLMLFLSCLIFKVGTLTEMPEVQEVMSNEQTSALDVPSLSLTILLFASAVFALVLSAALLVVQLALERARIAREASTSKARRLRKKDTGKEVEPPIIASNAWHVFLSHAWSTGRALPTPLPVHITHS
jgi:hypothetical protein